MGLEDIKDNLKEQAQEIWGRIEESPTYNTLKEKFEALPQATQRLTIGAIGFLIFLMIFMIPYGYYTSSREYISQYDEKRNLLRELMRASRLASDPNNTVRALDRTEIENQIRQSLMRFSLLPEQIEGVIDLSPEMVGPSIAPAEIMSVHVGLKLNKLNLRQVQEIGFQIQSLAASVKLVGMDIVADEPDPHYFNVVYKLVGYSLKDGP